MSNADLPVEVWQGSHDATCEMKAQTMGLTTPTRDPHCHCAKRAYQADPLPGVPWQPAKDPADTPAYNPALTWGMALRPCD